MNFAPYIPIAKARGFTAYYDKTHFEEREKLYLEIINRYNEQERNLFPELCANVITALESNPAQDFLGSIYMELGLGNHWKGQFFTPYSVCQCMAAMTLNNPVEQIRQKGYITINACLWRRSNADRIRESYRFRPASCKKPPALARPCTCNRTRH